VRLIYIYLNKRPNITGGTMCSFETSENICLTTCRKNPEDKKFKKKNRYLKLKFRKYFYYPNNALNIQII